MGAGVVGSNPAAATNSFCWQVLKSGNARVRAAGGFFIFVKILLPMFKALVQNIKLDDVSYFGA